MLKFTSGTLRLLLFAIMYLHLDRYLGKNTLDINYIIDFCKLH